MAMTTRAMNICTVDTPTHTYVKARASCTDTELIVMDRSGKELVRVPAPDSGPLADGRHTLVYGTDESNATRVRDMPGACGCGGLRIIEKSKTRKSAVS